MSTTTIRVDSDLLRRIESNKPNYLSATGYFQLLAEQALAQGLTGGTTLNGPSPQAGTHQGRGSINKEEEERVRALSLEGMPIPPAQGKPVDPALEAHTTLIRDFWRTKKGSKGEQAWKLLQRGLTAIQAAYGDEVVKEQLELAINGRWQSITLANYERFKPQPKAWEKEPEAKHPAYRDAREIIAEQEAKWKEIPSATGGRGVLDPNAFV